ncbi:uncharacterized protein cfap92 isoform X2 [Trichomycterus rosablanca]|uniref:uncharacterized protein cfap92 isoform X2 n=1 Tax=Trichomycterus rosablanca TaxID=2290929 RepID=UPI002F35CEE8
MEPDTFTALPKLIRHDNNDVQSSEKLETLDGNEDNNNMLNSFESENREHDTTDSCPLTSNAHQPCESDSGYTVTCMITMALAVPGGVEKGPVTAEEKEKTKSKKVHSSGRIEAPKPKSYYHIEYNLLPDSEPIKVDLVMFGSVAKVYMDNETKMLLPWQEEENVWIAWSQSVKLNMTKELLLKMPSHKIIFRLWDTKDKVCAKAKYDRPRAFRLPQRKSEQDPEITDDIMDSQLDQSGGIKDMVKNLRAVYEKENPISKTSKNFHKDIIPRQSEHNFAKDTSAALNETIQDNSEVTVDQEQDLEKPEKLSLEQSDKGFRDTTTVVKNQSSNAQLSVHENTAEMEDINKTGIASVELSAMPLLAGHRSLTDCLQIHSGSVLKGLCNITLDQPLMSKELKALFNPLVITILSASSLPSSPVPFAELEQCNPVYCQYRFHKMPTHKTKEKPHGSHILFKDVNVIFTGLLSPGELIEFLRGPPLQIEVHDRDRKNEEPVLSPAVFGSGRNDDKLASAVFVTIKQEKSQLRDPYGIAQLKLSDLLREHKVLNLTLPIRCPHPEQWLSSEKNEWGTNEPVTGRFEDSSMPMGHYMRANSELKVHVEIAHPLHPDPDESDLDCPFGCIVYIFKYDNVPVLNKLRSEILQINSAAFDLDDQTDKMAQKILCSHKMSAKERENKKLDVLTGFYMLDNAIHLFVLEGLKEQAIKQLWERVPIKLDEDTQKEVMVLYNSGLSFSERLYDTLDVGLSPIHLHESLEAILRKPLVYVRGMVPYSCLQAMLRISQLCQVRTLDEAVLNNLFPSAKMMYCLSAEFSRIHSQGEEKLLPDTQDLNNSVDHRVSQRRAYTHLDNVNKEYMEWKQSQADRGLHAKNFVQANIEDIHKASTALQNQKPKVSVAEVNDGQPVHNYSIQTLNSTVLAKELLFEEMAKHPTRRFSYSQNYHSLTLDPVDPEAERKVVEARSRAAWRTRDGFIYSGFKSSTESNQHPKQPDEARVMELGKPWRENILHGNTLKPILKRSTWSWSQRQEDFELYKKPPAVLGPSPPVSIHLAGETLHQEQLQAAREQYVRWLRKILPDVESTGSDRVPEFKCHMRRAGLDKLHDLLKDKPMKLTLKKAWKTLLPIPLFTEDQHSNTKITQRTERENNSCLLDTNTGYKDTSQHCKSNFACCWRPHSSQHKRAILPLTDEEKRLHVFQRPQNITVTYTESANPQHRRNVIEMRTYNSVTAHIK